MARNRVQFQKGYSLTQFMDEYGTEEKCREALFRWRWPNGFRLPKMLADRALSRSKPCQAPGGQVTTHSGRFTELDPDKLRGGYYTSPELATWLSSWAIRSATDRVLEPSCGDGAFLDAAAGHLEAVGLEAGETTDQILGIEILGGEAAKARLRLVSPLWSASRQNGGDRRFLRLVEANRTTVVRCGDWESAVHSIPELPRTPPQPSDGDHDAAGPCTEPTHEHLGPLRNGGAPRASGVEVDSHWCFLPNCYRSATRHNSARS